MKTVFSGNEGSDIGAICILMTVQEEYRAMSGGHEMVGRWHSR